MVKRKQKKKKNDRTKEIPKTTASPDLFPESLREEWKSQHDLTIDRLEEKLEEFVFSPSAPNPITLVLEYHGILSKMKVKRHLQNFLEDGNFDHVLNFLEAGRFDHVLGTIPKGGYEHPLLKAITSYLGGIILKEKFARTNQLREKAENYLKKIANAVAKSITCFTQVKVPDKTTALIMRLKGFPNYEDELKYLAGIYKKYKKESKKSGELKALIKLRNDKQSAIKRISQKVNSADTYQHHELKALKEEVDTLNSGIARETKEQQRKGHQEAKRITLNCLEKQTGIRIGSRELERLLSLANLLKSNE